ncbi:TIM barrel protein [Dactylosporangium siamense]|uniref:Sugar phosphate isomerase n=1 Tax=Dactylosporangium siamense TaxID=685454 RepID=A0A919UAC1_9ACTN|nr:TIM barrel protein [Dactylosporangium siamense]GIG48369.1 sugar phosphate isomerase [Dactylosporangium siamense]
MIGLCSVTMRRHPAADVVAVAAAAGLTAIEWAGDHHVPPSAPAVAAAVGVRTRDAGLAVAAYGSYYRCTDPADAAGTVAAAVALGAPRIRVWAGTTGSADASPRQRAAVAAAARRICDEAAGPGLTVAFECHRDTLTDTPASALALLAAVDRPNAAMYWQPPNDLPDAAALATLGTLLPHVVAVHAFSWWPGTRRLRLAERGDLWRAAAALLPGGIDVLLEFVPGDDPALIAPEAATLRQILGHAQPGFSTDRGATGRVPPPS